MFPRLALCLFRADALVADLDEPLHQHSELFFEFCVFLIERCIVAGGLLEELIHLLHIVAAKHGL